MSPIDLHFVTDFVELSLLVPPLSCFHGDSCFCRNASKHALPLYSPVHTLLLACPTFVKSDVPPAAGFQQRLPLGPRALLAIRDGQHLQGMVGTSSEHGGHQ